MSSSHASSSNQPTYEANTQSINATMTSNKPAISTIMRRSLEEPGTFEWFVEVDLGDKGKIEQVLCRGKEGKAAVRLDRRYESVDHGERNIFLKFIANDGITRTILLHSAPLPRDTPSPRNTYTESAANDSTALQARVQDEYDVDDDEYNAAADDGVMTIGKRGDDDEFEGSD